MHPTLMPLLPPCCALPPVDTGDVVVGHGHGENIRLPAERDCSRKRSPDAVRHDPKLASHSLALSCVSSVRLIGLKKKGLSSLKSAALTQNMWREQTC